MIGALARVPTQLISGRRRSCALVLTLVAWLIAAAITPGCYSMSVNPPRDAESKRALRVLKRHLAASLPFAKFSIEQLPTSTPGWTLFVSEDPDVRHGPLNYWVVRADKRVVTEDPLAELAHAYRSLEAARPEPLASPDDLAWIAVALLDNDTRLYDQRIHQQLSVAGPGSAWRTLYERYELAPPQLTRQADAASLVFWVYTAGRGMDLSRYELQISADYEVTVSHS